MLTIKNPPKPHWTGNPKVEPFMAPVAEVLDKYFDETSGAWTDIYNRVYEVIHTVIESKQ